MPYAFPHFDAAAFLRDTWQRRPLLIRNPWGQWHNPLEPDELAGLGCEPGIESRLVVGSDSQWQVEHGPLPESRFADLEGSPWTLLVQAVDQIVPDVAALIAPFRFIPDWRIDDVMVSYASDGGGVGPHYDQYDVFLIQGLGRRRWRVGPKCDEATPLLPHHDLRLLADFHAEADYVLEPGDILYLPPGFAHDGVALGDDCMTYSIGFRAPSRADLVGDFADDLIEHMAEDDRYADPGLAQQANPGEITADALARLHAMVTEALADKQAFASWFGRHASQPKYPDNDWRPDAPVSADDVRAMLQDGQVLERNPASRLAFVRRQDGGATLFADGQDFVVPMALAESLCAQQHVGGEVGWLDDETALDVLVALFNQGSLVVEDDED